MTRSLAATQQTTCLQPDAIPLSPARTHVESGMDAELGEHLVIADVHLMLIRKVVEAIAASGPDISEREKRRTALTLRETLEVCTSRPPHVGCVLTLVLRVAPAVGTCSGYGTL
jgi:hypothetical protein